jgi:hypothetical protein
MKFRIIAALPTLGLASCAGPTVNLATPEPVKVDIAMRLDIYQHERELDKNAPSPEAAAPEKDRLNRAADLQTFKNSGLIGEAANALLVIRVETPGDYGDQIRKTVEAENIDRMALLKAQVEREKLPLPAVQKKQAALARKMAFKGEWIEVEKADGSREWVQKGV